jgi:hypothetical protein
MINLSKVLFATVVFIAPGIMSAQTNVPSGSIAGIADPGAQIIVTGLHGGSVIGIVAACDGTYKAENLKPGQYSIVEGGPHHATRKLSVDAGVVSHVDLGSATADSTRACNEKKQGH